MQKKILITGASGYIGNVLLKKIIKKKNVKIIATYHKKKPLLSSDNLEWYKLDISKKRFNKKILSNIEYLIHLAWSNLNNFDDKKHINKVLPNHIFFLNKLISINRFKKIIISGTCFEYGNNYNGMVSENFTANPNIEYGKAKYLLYKEILKLKKKYNFQFDWLRIFYVYGYSGVRKSLWKQLNKSKSINIKNPYFIRDFIHVDKITYFIQKLIFINKSYDILNICSGKSWIIKRTIIYWKKKYNLKIKLSFSNSNLKSGIYGDVKKLKLIK